MANTGCCGMDCDGCEARRATVRRDNEALAKIAAHLESAGQGSFILPSRLRCTGCLAPGVKSVNCAECAIRECALENQITAASAPSSPASSAPPSGKPCRNISIIWKF